MPDEMAKVNPDGEWICCLGCGRETRAVYGFCRRCMGEGHYASHVSETKGRRGRSIQTLTGMHTDYFPLPEDKDQNL